MTQWRFHDTNLAKYSQFVYSIAQKRATCADLVFGVRRAGVDGLNDNVGVEKMRGDHVGDERGVVFLENDRHYVVADVTFSLKLLTRKKYTCTYTVTSVSHSKVLLNSRQL